MHYVRPGVPVYLIDPNPVDAAVGKMVTHLQMGASEGMRKLVEILSGKKV
jgi:NAD-dependent deacetylase